MSGRIRVPAGYTLVRPGFARGPLGGYYRWSDRTGSWNRMDARAFARAMSAHPASAAAAASYSDDDSDSDGQSAVNEVERFLARGDSESAAAAVRAVQEFVAHEAKVERKHGIAEVPQCAVCMDAIKSNAKMIRCGHTFHKTCIDKWVRRSPTCPICRAHT